MQQPSDEENSGKDKDGGGKEGGEAEEEEEVVGGEICSAIIHRKIISKNASENYIQKVYQQPI